MQKKKKLLKTKEKLVMQYEKKSHKNAGTVEKKRKCLCVCAEDKGHLNIKQIVGNEYLK